jgi:hypothetical protein
MRARRNGCRLLCRYPRRCSIQNGFIGLCRQRTFRSKRESYCAPCCFACTFYRSRVHFWPVHACYFGQACPLTLCAVVHCCVCLCTLLCVPLCTAVQHLCVALVLMHLTLCAVVHCCVCVFSCFSRLLAWETRPTVRGSREAAKAAEKVALEGGATPAQAKTAAAMTEPVHVSMCAVQVSTTEHVCSFIKLGVIAPFVLALHQLDAAGTYVLR